MSKTGVVLLVGGVVVVGVGAFLFLGHRAKVKAAAAKQSSSGGISSGDVVSFIKGAVPVVQGIVEYFND